jgi:hypothetical protein
MNRMQKTQSAAGMVKATDQKMVEQKRRAAHNRL